ncbi:MAG: phosphatidylserine decarboxylase [Phycisphaerales bacterium]
MQNDERKYPVVAREGWPIVAVFVLSAALATWGGFAWFGVVGWAIGAIGLVLCAWCVWFFRDPIREVPGDAGVVVSPADGVVCAVDRVPPPKDAGLSDDESRGMLRVCVFMNVFNVHVNRAPVAGRVVGVQHTSGRFFNASLDKASAENERLSLVLEQEDGSHVVAVQIAGLIARRIVCRARVGDVLGRGGRYGLIRFGSRVDVHMPAGAEAMVRVGDRAIAGETVLARLAASAAVVGEVGGDRLLRAEAEEPDA